MNIQSSKDSRFTLFKTKIKQNRGCPNKEYNAIFQHIHYNIRAYSRSKEKSALINYQENIVY